MALTDNTTALQEIIAKVNELPNAGSVGVETCTIIINNTSNTYWGYACTVYRDGEYGVDYVKILDGVGVNPVTISDVVCGSGIALYNTQGYFEKTSDDSITITPLTKGHHYINVLPSAAGGTHTAYFYPMD